jgi:hypothetical protein
MCSNGSVLRGQKIDNRPTRLLQLVHGDSQPIVRLVHTAQLDVENLSYVTLSHCWGKTLIARLLKDLVKEYSLDIPWESLTSTFQDAIVTSLKLGIHYIWIDALCIIQDDKEDWIHEAARMTGVYLNSYLNISADASRDGTEGLFRRRNPKALQSFIVPHWKGNLKRCASIFYTDRWFSSVYFSPLANRAWTVQERFLAPRVLHFAAEEVHWECMELFTAESLPTLLNTIPVSNAIIRKSGLRYGLPEQERIRVLYDIWYQLVTAYSAGTLTFTSDRAIAFAGLAGIFCRLLGLSESDYLCGIWRPQLEHDLMWRRHGSCWKPQDSRISELPSWSWLSLCSDIWTYSGWCWGDRDDDGLITAKAVHASTARSQVAFGPVSSGTVTLRVFLCQSTMSRGNPPFYDELEDCDHFMNVDGSMLREQEHFEYYLDDPATQIIDKPVYLMLGRARDPACDNAVASLASHPR